MVLLRRIYVRGRKRATNLVAVFLVSSNMKRAEMHPVVSHGDILHEKLGPKMLSFVPCDGCV